MGCVFSQIGLGFDLNGALALEVIAVGFVIWCLGFASAWIGLALFRRGGPRFRTAPVVLGTATLLAAMVLWVICFWGYTEWGFGYGVVPSMALFALTDTCVAAGVLRLPARK